MTFALQQSLKDELNRLQKHQITAPSNEDRTSGWCNSFHWAPKPNGKVLLFLDPARLNKVLIRSVHRVLTLNDILPRLAGVTYLTPIDVSLGYLNLKLDQ